MKAMLIERFGPPSVLVEHELPQPVPGPGEALIRIHACGVNRMDTELRAGTYGGEPLQGFFFGRDVVLPHLAGIEPAGEVVALGEGAAGVAIGEHVVPHSHLACGHCRHCLAGHDNACASIKVLGVQTPGKGGYAQFLAWPAARLMRFGAGLPFTTAAAVTVNYGPVWCGLVERAGLLPGETLLVTGAAGGCGHAAIDLGRLLGARVIAVTRSPDKVAGLRAAGAEEVVVSAGPGWHAEVLALTQGAGADVVCELVGAANWADSVSAAAQRGRVVVIGSHGGLHAALNLGEVFGKNLAILGVTRASQPAMARVMQLAERGRLHPAISAVLPLAQAAEAHRRMETGEFSGKLVLEMG